MTLLRALCVAALLLPAGVASAAEPPRDLALIRYHDQAASLLLVDRDGGRELVVGDASGEDPSPEWSRDGSAIAFSREPAGAPGVAEIFTVDARGANLRQVTHFGAMADSPSWSPDGTRLVFRGVRPGGRPALYVVRADGSGLHRIANTRRLGTASPDWSPDGRRIAFRYRGHITLIRPSGRGRTFLTDSSRDLDPAWSRNGRRVAFARSGKGAGGIYVVNVATARERRLTSTGCTDEHPVWDPGGGVITFLRNGGVHAVDPTTRLEAVMTGKDAGPHSWRPGADPLGGVDQPPIC